jgi:glycosyltransferase involved in cell wall biosynthesis
MKKVLVRGPALSRSGYGEHTRYVLRALRTSKDVDLYFVNTNWGETSWLFEDNEERKWIDSLLLKTIEKLQVEKTFDISVQVTIPNEWEKIATVNIGVTAGIETTKISDAWAQRSYVVDKIIVPSEHAKNGFTSYKKEFPVPNSEEVREVRCVTPVEVVPYPFRDISGAEVELNLPTEFNFLSVAQISPRKNIEATVVGFVEEFYNENVGLVLKVNIKNNSLIDRFHTDGAIKTLLEQYKDRVCKVYLLHGNMTDEEMVGLYRHSNIKAMVSMTHGEGFGLPIFEAGCNELPIIAPVWSGHSDFVNAPVGKKGKVKTLISEVKYTLDKVQPTQVWEGVIEADADWCYPDISDYKKVLRGVYNNYEQHLTKAKKLSKHLAENYKQDELYDKLITNILEV